MIPQWLREYFERLVKAAETIAKETKRQNDLMEKRQNDADELKKTIQGVFSGAVAHDHERDNPDCPIHGEKRN